MYLGSAAAMLVLPSVSAAFGPASLLRLVGCLGLAWLLLWLAVGREIPHRCDLQDCALQYCHDAYCSPLVHLLVSVLLHLGLELFCADTCRC
jgi:hypothetical protein